MLNHCYSHQKCLWDKFHQIKSYETIFCITLLQKYTLILVNLASFYLSFAKLDSFLLNATADYFLKSLYFLALKLQNSLLSARVQHFYSEVMPLSISNALHMVDWNLSHLLRKKNTCLSTSTYFFSLPYYKLFVELQALDFSFRFRIHYLKLWKTIMYSDEDSIWVN